MPETTIYALVDPRSGAVRYVGKTQQGCAVRLGQHMRVAASGAEGHRNHWIRELARAGYAPTIRVLAVVLGDDWAAAEREWIAHFKACGASLTNGTLGGEGCPGRRASDATKARIGAAHRGKIETEETRARKSAAARGKCKSEAWRASIRARALERSARREEQLRQLRAQGASIAGLVAAGFSYRAIGRAVGVCHHTIKDWMA